MCYTFEFLIANVISTRRDNTLGSSKRDVTLDFQLGTPDAPRHIGSGIVKETFDVEFDETNERYGGVDGDEYEEEQRKP